MASTGTRESLLLFGKVQSSTAFITFQRKSILKNNKNKSINNKSTLVFCINVHQKLIHRSKLANCK